MTEAAWHQLTQLINCPDCTPGTQAFTKDDVVTHLTPCEKHERMLDSQGWEVRDELTSREAQSNT